MIKIRLINILTSVEMSKHDLIWFTCYFNIKNTNRTYLLAVLVLEYVYNIME